MTDDRTKRRRLTSKADTLERDGVVWERLYRIELYQWKGPMAPYWDCWEQRAALNDVRDKTPDELLEEVSDFLSEETGRWKMRIICWTGEMYTPRMEQYGNRNTFLYDYSPRGSGLVCAHEEVIHLG